MAGLTDHFLAGEDNLGRQEMIDAWSEAICQLPEWQKAGHSMKTYHSGIIANHDIFARDIGFGRFGKDGRKSKKEEFVWSPAKRRKARTLHVSNSDSVIAKKMDCPETDLREIWDDLSGKLELF
jgi:hypothetical protein